MARKPAAPRAGKTRGREPDAIDPKHRWDRPIQAPGHTQGWPLPVSRHQRVSLSRAHSPMTVPEM